MTAIVSLSSRISSAQVLLMLDACTAQIKEDYAPAWGVVPRVPEFYMRQEDVPSGVPLIVLLDQGDVPGAAGWHTQDGDGRVTGVVVVGALLDAGFTYTDGANSISCVMSHELLEADQDPWVDYWVDMLDGQQDAFELCDRVQGNSYVKNGVAVSDFLLPTAFDGRPPAGSKFDFLGVLSSPFEIAQGGYAVRRAKDGTTSQVGERNAAKVHEMSRSTRRQGR